MNAAKSKYGVPTDQSPEDLKWVPDTQGNGLVPVYHYQVIGPDGKIQDVYVRDDGFGHEYPDCPDRGPHFNGGNDPNNLRDHFDYEGPFEILLYQLNKDKN